MRSPVLSALVILSIICPLIVQTREECVCEGLGQGADPCSCSKVIVRAAKVAKPAYPVPPLPPNGRDPISQSRPIPCSESNSFDDAATDTSVGSRKGRIFGANVPYSDNSNEYRSKQGIEPIDGNAIPRFLPIGDLCCPLSTGENIGKKVGKVKPARPGKMTHRGPAAAPYETCVNKRDFTETVKGGRIVSDSFDTTSTPNAEMYETLDSGRIGRLSDVYSESAPAPSASSIGNSFETFPKSNPGIYNAPPLAYFRLNTEDARTRYPKANAEAEAEAKATVDSNSADYSDDATGEIQNEFYPADPSSLTLAYRHLRGPNVIYGKRKRYVPEDKLSFGHPTLPTDVIEENRNANVAEERLVTVNEPVVELNLAPSRIVIINSYGRNEEVEKIGLRYENVAQVESVDRVPDNLLAYKDLGYSSVKATYQKTDSHESTAEEGDAISGEPIGNNPEGTDENTEIQTLAFERRV